MSSSSADLEKILETLEAAVERKLYRKLDFFEPYPKQRALFDLGATKRERMFMAGNQLGKSESGAYETALHLTGDYPDWWTGYRFDKPIRAWAVGETSQMVRDVQQRKLCGEPGVEEAFGTGYIPRAAFVDKPALARGITDAYDTIQVRHKTGGVSILRFKSYEQGRSRFQGETLDFIWQDEEGPMDIYTECITRTNATNGLILITFTPLKGKTELVMRFLEEEHPDRGIIRMTFREKPGISDEEIAKEKSKYPIHEQEARINGEPMMGEGRIFPYSDEQVMEARIGDVPLYWKKMWAIDFGIGHPFAAVLGAWDVDNDVIHILHTIRIADALPLMHAAAMKPIGANVPVAWPKDGGDREKSTGETLASAYKKAGLVMLSNHATWEDGGISTEAGILEMQTRMQSGRLKVASHLSDWFEEYRSYHRKDGQIVKVRDDLMSATRIFVMAKRYARPVHLGGTLAKRRSSVVASDVDFDFF